MVDWLSFDTFGAGTGLRFQTNNKISTIWHPWREQRILDPDPERCAETFQSLGKPSM